jgi:hypothetical protein
MQFAEVLTRYLTIKGHIDFWRSRGYTLEEMPKQIQDLISQLFSAYLLLSDAERDKLHKCDSFDNELSELFLYQRSLHDVGVSDSEIDEFIHPENR